jgi:hypothetical protein
VPVGDDGGIVDDEDIGAVRPLVDGIIKPVEVRPPERLVLALVITAGRRHQGDRHLFGCAVVGGSVAGELCQRRGKFVVFLDGVVLGDRLDAHR